MKTKLLTTLFASLVLFSTSLFAADIQIENPWVRAAPPNAPAMGAFMMIKNSGDKTVKLLQAKVPGYKRVELHRTQMADGMMKMIKQEFIPVEAGGMTVLKPGSWHVMLIEPEKVPAPGEKVAIELVFDNGQNIKLEAPVKKMKMKMKMNMDHMHHMNH